MEFINFISEEFIDLNMDCANKEDLFQALHNKLFKMGYVTEEFKEKILEREEIFPTGINLGEYGVAIPHTDAKYIKKEFISICTFKDEIELNSMKNQNEVVQVKLAFVLGLNQSYNQLKVLTELITVIQNKDLVEKIVNSSNKDEVIKVVQSAI